MSSIALFFHFQPIVGRRRRWRKYVYPHPTHINSLLEDLQRCIEYKICICFKTLLKMYGDKHKPSRTYLIRKNECWIKKEQVFYNSQDYDITTYLYCFEMLPLTYGQHVLQRRSYLQFEHASKVPRKLRITCVYTTSVEIVARILDMMYVFKKASLHYQKGATIGLFSLESTIEICRSAASI